MRRRISLGVGPAVHVFVHTAYAPVRAQGVVLAACSLALAGCMRTPEIAPFAPLQRQCAAVGAIQVGGRVDWYHPVEVGDNQKLDEWCRAVGPVVIDSVPSGGFRALRSDDPVAVTAWNTDAGSGHLMAFLQEELGLRCAGRDSRLEEGAPHFVLLVQEALRRSNDVPDVSRSWATPPPVAEETHPGERLDLLQATRACGLAAFYAPAGRNGIEPRDGLREDKGNAIVSTLPLSDFVVVELPYEGARRVVPMATVRNIAGDSLRVASVHLITTPPPWRVLVNGNSARLRQVLALADALREVEMVRTGAEFGARPCGASCQADAPLELVTPTVVGGDMNAFSRRETAIRRLRLDFPDSPGFLSEGTRGAFPTDHLFFHRGRSEGATLLPATYRRIVDRHYSDHNPVLALFAFG